MPPSYWILLFFLFISKWAPKCCGELSESCKTVNTHEVSTALGSNAELPCSVPVPQYSRMKWDRYASANAQSYTVQTWPKATLPPKHLNGARLTFQWGEEGVKVGNLSLSLKDVRKNDSGTYTCWVWNGWQCMIKMSVILKIKECEVLKPITALPKRTVVLPCPFTSYQGNTPTPEVSWFLGPEGQKSRIPFHGKFRFSGDLNSGNASLTISELNSSDTNWYSCELHMGGKKHCQQMKLHVKDFSVSEVITTAGRVNVTVKANAKEETSGSPVVAVVSALSVCVAVAVVGSAIFIRYRKKTNAAEEDPADAPYANIHTQGSACAPSDLYSYAECEI